MIHLNLLDIMAGIDHMKALTTFINISGRFREWISKVNFPHLFIHLFIPRHSVKINVYRQFSQTQPYTTRQVIYTKSLTRNGLSPFSRNRDHSRKTSFSGTTIQVNRLCLHHQHIGRVCPKTTGLKLGLGGSEHSGCTFQDALDNPWSLGKAKGP